MKETKEDDFTISAYYKKDGTLEITAWDSGEVVAFTLEIAWDYDQGLDYWDDLPGLVRSIVPDAGDLYISRFDSTGECEEDCSYIDYREG